MPCARSTSSSSPPRPNTNGSPPLSRTTRLPARACSSISAWICVLRGVVVAGLLADFDALRIAPHQLQHLGADQAIVQDHVGLVEHAQRAQRQQARDRPGRRRPARPSPARVASALPPSAALNSRSARQTPSLAQQARQRTGKQALEEAAALAESREAGADARALAAQQFRQRAERFVELRFQFLAQVARQHRRAAAAGDRHLQRAALDARRNLDAGGVRVVDHVDPDPPRFAGLGDGMVDARRRRWRRWPARRRRASCGWNAPGRCSIRPSAAMPRQRLGSAPVRRGGPVRRPRAGPAALRWATLPPPTTSTVTAAQVGEYGKQWTGHGVDRGTERRYRERTHAPPAAEMTPPPGGMSFRNDGRSAGQRAPGRGSFFPSLYSY